MNHPDTNGPELRSIDDSLRGAHQSMFAVEGQIDAILSVLSPRPGSGSTGENPLQTGLVEAADRLAGRIQALVPDLERIRNLISRPTVVSMEEAVKGMQTDFGRSQSAFDR